MQEADTVRESGGAHEGHEIVEVGDVRKTGGGRRLSRGSGKRVDWVLSG